MGAVLAISNRGKQLQIGAKTFQIGAELQIWARGFQIGAGITNRCRTRGMAGTR